VTNPIEMGMQSWDAVVARLQSIEGYKQPFEQAFGKDPISKDTVTKAIAAYERTLITPNSPYDGMLAETSRLYLSNKFAAWKKLRN